MGGDAIQQYGPRRSIPRRDAPYWPTTRRQCARRIRPDVIAALGGLAEMIYQRLQLRPLRGEQRFVVERAGDKI
jgi:hypothetical protein